MFSAINPATGQQIARYEEMSQADISAALDGAVSAQRGWRMLDVSERVGLLTRLAVRLRADARELADLITAEMGKPITEALAEIEKCAWCCDYYAAEAPAMLAYENHPSAAAESGLVYDPLGVVLAVMPWNYPFWQFFRFAAPALAAGNGILLKHASNVPGSALRIERLMLDAGSPQGLMRTLMVGAGSVAAIVADDRVAAVTLTGSTEVGSIVAAQAGKALKKQVLELGGSDPFIVLADADVERAAATAVRSRFINVGQSCVNAKRFIVHESVIDRFTDAFVRGAAALVVADPMDPKCQIGPLARANLRDTLHDQVERSLASGAKLLLGGAPVDRPGFYYDPTVLAHVEPGMAAFTEELFGPVAAIISASSTDNAIELANDTEFGLAATIWSADTTAARRLARRVDAGAVFINGLVASDPRLPFGGIKRSGYGRELGTLGLREFVNIKTIWVGADP